MFIRSFCVLFVCVMMPGMAVAYDAVIHWTRPGIHLVERGDTLADLAGRYRTTVDELMRVNPGICDRDLIYSGSVIRIPPPFDLIGRWETPVKVELSPAVAEKLEALTRSVNQVRVGAAAELNPIIDRLEAVLREARSQQVVINPDQIRQLEEKLQTLFPGPAPSAVPGWAIAVPWWASVQLLLFILLLAGLSWLIVSALRQARGRNIGAPMVETEPRYERQRVVPLKRGNDIAKAIPGSVPKKLNRPADLEHWLNTVKTLPPETPVLCPFHCGKSILSKNCARHAWNNCPNRPNWVIEDGLARESIPLKEGKTYRLKP